MKSKSIVILVAAALLSVKCLCLLGQSPGDVRPNPETQRTEIYDGRKWVPFKGRQLTVTDLASLRISDGQSVQVEGYSQSGDAGKPWELNFHQSGQSGVTIDGGFFVAGPGDSYWEASDQTIAVATRFGCKSDWSYPNGGQDNTAAFNALFATGAPKVIIPAGSYRIEDTIEVPNGCHIEAVGATLICNILGRTDRHILELSGDFYSKTLRLPGVHGYQLPQLVPYGHEHNSAIAFTGACLNNDIFLQACHRHPVGFLLAPRSTVGAAAYNRIYGGTFTGTRTCIGLRGDVNVGETGWVNENSFYGPNCTVTSNSDTLGSHAGVMFSAVSGGYSGQNNNRFYAPCFQLGNYTESKHKLTVGKTVALHGRYVNRDDLLDGESDNFGEYVCTTLGSGGVATVPTHDTPGQEVVDPNGYGFTFVGPWYRVPVWHEYAGGRNKFSGCRWEGGDGPFAVLRDNTSVETRGNVYELYKNTSDATRTRPMIRHRMHHDGANYAHQMENTILTYSDRETTTSVQIENVHLRAIKSADGWHIPGFFNWNYFTWAISQSLAVDLKLCHENLYVNNAPPDGAGFLIDWGNASQMYLRFDAPGYSTSEITRGIVHARTEGRLRYQITGSTDRNLIVNYGTTPNTTYDFFASQAGQSSVLMTKSDAIRETFVGFRIQGRLRSIEVEARLYGGKPNAPQLSDFYGRSPLDGGARITSGAPTAGFFLQSGEVIDNIDNTASQPVGYRVTSPGILAPAWVTATAYIEGELVENAGKIYRAVAAGTSGGTAPTHSSGSASDGTIDWYYVDTTPTITALSETYP